MRVVSFFSRQKRHVPPVPAALAPDSHPLRRAHARGPETASGIFFRPAATRARKIRRKSLKSRRVARPAATKSASGVRYYGRRYYEPKLGRWLGRDPIEEKGGLNLYGFVRNNGVNKWDYLGMQGGMAPGDETVVRLPEFPTMFDRFGDYFESRFNFYRGDIAGAAGDFGVRIVAGGYALDLNRGANTNNKPDEKSEFQKCIDKANQNSESDRSQALSDFQNRSREISMRGSISSAAENLLFGLAGGAIGRVSAIAISGSSMVRAQAALNYAARIGSSSERVTRLGNAIRNYNIAINSATAGGAIIAGTFNDFVDSGGFTVNHLIGNVVDELSGVPAIAFGLQAAEFNAILNVIGSSSNSNTITTLLNDTNNLNSALENSYPDLKETIRESHSTLSAQIEASGQAHTNALLACAKLL